MTAFGVYQRQRDIQEVNLAVYNWDVKRRMEQAENGSIIERRSNDDDGC